MDEFKPIVLTNNFAGFAYDESADKLLSRGAHSIRKEIMDTPEGTAMLQTKNGMPRVIGLRKEKCKEQLFPITELHYDSREFFDDVEDPKENGFRLFSHDGLYSIGLNKIKSILVASASSKTSFRMIRAVDGNGAEGAAGNFVEKERLLGGQDHHIVAATEKHLLSFICNALEFVKFVKAGCSNALTELILRCGASSANESATYGEIFGDYAQTGVTKDKGPATSLLGANGKRLEINLSAPGGFLESFNSEAMSSITRDAWRTKAVGGERWLPAEKSFDAAGWFPQSKSFSSPLKGFLTPLGMFSDETMTSELKLEDAGIPHWEGADAPSFDTDVAPNMDRAPRYFNFLPDAEDVDVPGTYFKMRHDAQFNYGVASPSKDMVEELDDTHHLYRDPEGVVWLIEVRAFENHSTRCTTITAVVKLLRRFDPIYEPSLTNNINRELASLDSPTEFLPINDPALQDAYGTKDIPYKDPMNVVASLPNGTACALNVINSPIKGVNRFNHTSGLLERHATYAIFMIRFSGTGGNDGAGVVATIDAVPVIRSWIEVDGTDIVVGNHTQSYSGSPVFTKDKNYTDGRFLESDLLFFSNLGGGQTAWASLRDVNQVFEYSDIPASAIMIGGLASRVTDPNGIPGFEVDVYLPHMVQFDKTVSYVPFANVSASFLVQLIPSADNTFQELTMDYTYSRRDEDVRWSGSGAEHQYKYFYTNMADKVVENTVEGYVREFTTVGKSLFRETSTLTYRFGASASTLTYDRKVTLDATINESGGSSVERMDVTVGDIGRRITTTSSGSFLTMLAFNIDEEIIDDSGGFSGSAPSDDTGIPMPALEYCPVYCYTDGVTGGQILRPTTVLWAGKELSSDAKRECVCLDPRHDRLYVAPEPNAAGLFF